MIILAYDLRLGFSCVQISYVRLFFTLYIIHITWYVAHLNTFLKICVPYKSSFPLDLIKILSRCCRLHYCVASENIITLTLRH